MSKHSTSSKGLNQIKNLIRGSKYPLAEIAINRGKIRLADVRPLASWVSNLYQNNRRVLHGQFPRRIGDFRRPGVLAPVSLEREIIWAGESIKQHSSSIKSFIGLARKYEVHLMRGDYGVCTALLDQIENHFGVSFWVLENRIALLQVSEGLEKQKQYAAKIKEARSKNDVVAFTVFNLSHRNEDSATPGRFIGELKDRLDGWGVDKDLQSFLLFRLCDLGPNDETQYGDILRLEASSAIIDYYETFIRLSERALSSGNLAIFRLFIQDLTVLAPLTEDTRINKMLFIADIPGSWLVMTPTRNLSAVSLMVNESYQEAMALAEMLQATDEKDSNHWLTNVAASAALGLNLHCDETTLRAKITNMARSIISRAGDIRDAEIGLSKHILNFRLMNFSFMLELFLAQEQSADPRPNTSTALLAFINSPFLDPEIIQHLPSFSQRESYSALLIEKYGLTPVVALEFRRAGRASEALPHTNSLTERQADLERLMSEKAFSQALIKARELGEALQFRIRRIAARAECNCLLSLQRTDELVDLIVSRCLDDPGM
ncbi:MAG TPA: hypothetical protein PKH78_14785, partial [Candidatus Obscuribacter sp.]|nr:hypothetical protein [Candidatus Obscuribacter sp.]